LKKEDYCLSNEWIGKGGKISSYLKRKESALVTFKRENVGEGKGDTWARGNRGPGLPDMVCGGGG